MNAGRWSSPAMLMAAVIFALMAAGCSSGSVETVAPLPSADCVDDSRACVERRAAALRMLVADRNRSWVREPATAHSYAAGVRLFAFKSRKRELTCEELVIGVREADAGPRMLRGPDARGLTPAQVSRGTMLAGEVAKELRREMQRRSCRQRV